MPYNSFENYPMSWKPRLEKNAGPLYAALADQLEQDILQGRLLPGTKLPPQRELADYLDINVSTVTKAFRACELKGLLSATVGSGTFVSYNALTNLRLLSDETPGHIIEMGATVPDSETGSLLLPYLKEMVSEPGAERLFRYNRPGDTRLQRDAAVLWMKRCGLNARHSDILFASGGQNAIAASLIGLLRDGDRLGAAPHTYSDMKAAAIMLGIPLCPLKLTDGAADADAFAYAFRQYDLKGIYVIPDHQNPTTRTMPVREREMLASAAREQDAFIIEDGTYSMIGPSLPPVASFAPERTIYIASLSKAIAPGLRLAYVYAPFRYRQRVSDALYNLNISVSPLMAELAARLIVSGRIDPILDEHKRKTALRNALTDKYLSGFDCRGGENSIFRWLMLPEGITGTAFEAAALERGVQVYAAERFSVGLSAPDRAVRVAVCSPELPELERGLQILRQLLDEK